MSETQESEKKPKAKRRRRSSKKAVTPPTSLNMSGAKNKEKSGRTSVNGSNTGATPNSQPKPIFPSANPFMSPAGVFNPTSITQNPWMNDFSQKLEFIMSKMATLDTIVAKQNDVLLRLGQIESSIEKHSKEISNLKSSQNSNTQATHINKQSIAKVQGECKKLADENKALKTTNSSLKEEVVDLQCRSMRENLLFMGIPEENSNFHQWSSQTPAAQPSMHTSLEIDTDSTIQNKEQTTQKSYAEAISVEEKPKFLNFVKVCLKFQTQNQSLTLMLPIELVNGKLVKSGRLSPNLSGESTRTQ